MIIALVCALPTIVGAVVACAVINASFARSIVSFLFSVMNFRFVNDLIILGTAAVVAFLGTFFPVRRAAEKPPVVSFRAL